MTAYTKSYTAWADSPSTSTPITAAKMQNIDDGVMSAAHELGVQSFTANVTISATAEAIANTIVTAPSITFDGSTTVMIHFFSYLWQFGGASAGIGFLSLYEDGSSILGQLARAGANSVGSGSGAICIAHRMTPSAGAHVYSIRGWRDSGGNWTMSGDIGGAGNGAPGYIRITTA